MGQASTRGVTRDDYDEIGEFATSEGLLRGFDCIKNDGLNSLDLRIIQTNVDGTETTYERAVFGGTTNMYTLGELPLLGDCERVVYSVKSSVAGLSTNYRWWLLYIQ